MHIVLGLLTTIVTILYLLDRVGVNLGGMNPFHWRRKRAWSNRYNADPIYSVEDPVHIAAILIVGAAKLNGDISAQQKKEALNQFESKFSLDSQAASDLFGSAAHLLGGPQVIDAQLQGLSDRSKDSFSREQAESMIQMIIDVVSIDGDSSVKQREFIESIRSQLVPPEKSDGTW